MLNNYFIRLLVFYVFTFLISGNVYTQGGNFEKKHKRLDSIINCSNCPDTSIISAYVELAEMLYVSNMDTVVYLSNIVLDMVAVAKPSATDSVSLKSLDDNLSAAYNNLGYVYFNKGNTPVALEYFIKALKILEANKEYKGVAILLNNIGVICHRENDDEKSLGYHERALKIHQTLGDKNGEASSLNKIGDIYLALDNGGTAEMYYIQSNNIYFELEEKKLGISSNYHALGNIRFNEGRFDEAMDYAKLMLSFSNQIGYKIGIAKANMLIAKVLLNEGDIIGAEKKARQSLRISEKQGLRTITSEVSFFLSNLYEKEGKNQKALEMFILYSEIKSELQNQESAKSIAHQQAKFEYEQKQIADSIIQHEALKIKNTEIALSKAESEKGKLKIEQQKKQKWYLYFGLGFLTLLGAFMYNRFRVTNKQKNIIARQKELADNQKKEIQKQHLLLEVTHKEIKDSINYAKRLQTAILPAFENVNEYLTDSFVFFKPKDVVSGDFYWFEHVDGVSYIAAADCTGHGVPGALVSVVCSNALNRSVKEFEIKEPSKILDKTRSLVIETFANSGDNVKDGMDIAFCAIDGMKISFSGAGNPLWIVKDTVNLTDAQKVCSRNLVSGSKALIDVKGDKQPIGLYEDMTLFEQLEVELHKGDIIYLFTDGFADQFGGEKGKKFKYKPFKRLLLEINGLPMEKQREELNVSFEKWKGDLEQVDDVCVMGIMFDK